MDRDFLLSLLSVFNSDSYQVIIDNEPIRDEIEFAGDGEYYYFEANAGDDITVFVDNLTHGGTQQLYLSIIAPEGNPFNPLVDDASDFAGEDLDVFVENLPVDGTYTILVENIGDVTGDYTVGLTNFTQGALTIEDNEPIRDEIEFAGDGEYYYFEANAGDDITVFVDNLTHGGTQQLYLSIIAPEGNPFNPLVDDASDFAGEDLDVFVENLPVDGTYTILVENIGDVTGNYTVGLTLHNNAPNNNTPILLTFTSDQDCYNPSQTAEITGNVLELDQIGLTDDLTFGALNLTHIGDDTSVIFNDQELAIIRGVKSSDLTDNHFVEVTI